MDTALKTATCVMLAAMASVCLRRRVDRMEYLDAFIFSLDNLLDTSRKRHIVGGILLSASALFGGLAVTVLTIKN